ncbi:type I 3-dehydroquinate dehydratase [Sutterella sp.]|uniref:type I 3-dehydroquinate dehydratase n=1 Tax=Sutterella sp. TaxID=1981025 RepID=UPI0026DFD594|nr:type I 3-dehydroquinate dehydratase [Sutterella sp.]MDO5530912.1 type I 3-dehydroquinate dehydratase [Sutterella sp.]
MKTVTLKNVTLGEGAPKILVSLMAADIEAVNREAAAYQAADFDILEWRADFFSAITETAKVLEALRALREAFPGKPILFTFRSKAEGGEQALDPRVYTDLNIAVAGSGLVDAIDLELFTGDEFVKEALAEAHAKGVKVIMSSHDFKKTPPKAELLARLTKMQELGADVPKVAVMPQSKADVIELLAATAAFSETADRPVITMSMSKTGVISRLSGEAFGSAATFGAVAKVSAPGQISVGDLRTVLDILHRA